MLAPGKYNIIFEGFGNMDRIQYELIDDQVFLFRSGLTKKCFGKNICIAVINHFIEKKYAKVILQTDDWRIPAIAVYLKLGFKPVFTSKELEIRWNKIINTYFKDFIIKSIKPGK